MTFCHLLRHPPDAGAPVVYVPIDAEQLADLVASVHRRHTSRPERMLALLAEAATGLGIGYVAPLVAADGSRWRLTNEGGTRWVEVVR